MKTFNKKKINEGDCINARLLDLLVYLNNRFPSQGWGQFYTNASDTGSLQWNMITVAGHSQGAGNAQIIAYFYSVARSIQFAGGVAGVDLSVQFALTPIGRYFGFASLFDSANSQGNFSSFLLFLGRSNLFF